MKYFLFKNKELIVSFGSLIICLLFSLILSKPIILVQYLFFVIFFGINIFIGINLVNFFLEEFIETDYSYVTIDMTLSSKISVITKDQLSFAKFELKDLKNKKTICFLIESKNGQINCEYNQLNLDYLLIKPQKTYSICLKKITFQLDNKEIESKLIPVSIDYYNLEETVYFYQVIV